MEPCGTPHLLFSRLDLIYQSQNIVFYFEYSFQTKEGGTSNLKEIVQQRLIVSKGTGLKTIKCNNSNKQCLLSE